MRQIKFRCWHEGYNPDHKNGIQPQMLFDAKVGDCLAYKAGGQPVILMQWTGLYDCAGADVYEGDIIPLNKVHAVVEYDGCIAGFVLRGEYAHDLVDCIDDGVVVIGNIYQNRDMLE